VADVAHVTRPRAVSRAIGREDAVGVGKRHVNLATVR
jgi:hypothetical protein